MTGSSPHTIARPQRRRRGRQALIGAGAMVVAFYALSFRLGVTRLSVDNTLWCTEVSLYRGRIAFGRFLWMVHAEPERGVSWWWLIPRPGSLCPPGRARVAYSMGLEGPVFSSSAMNATAGALPLWPAALAAGAGSLWLMHAALTERLARRRHGACEICGYDRAGLGHEKPCPECGAPAGGAGVGGQAIAGERD